jgi:hypothetical protein
MSWISKVCVAMSLTMIVSLESQAGSTIGSSGISQPKITIRFFNYAPVPTKILGEARERVTAINHRSGIAIDWVECPVGDQDPSQFPACTEDYDATHLFLHLLPQAAKTIKMERAGESLLSVRMANIYWNRVREKAKSMQVEVERLLAHAVAHEVGHLLLGSNSHSPSGIMVGKWSRQDLINISQSGLSFSAKQSKFIQAEVQRRMKKQPMNQTVEVDELSAKETKSPSNDTEQS